jgi:5'-nucleotidase (lipoprotein e(P4) family)
MRNIINYSRPAVILALAVFISQVAKSQDSTQYTVQQEARMREMAVLFQQTAAEYRALCYQAFNMARLRLDAIPEQQLRKSKAAIITDLDETILDNSPSAAKLIREGAAYSSKAWKAWTDQSAARAVPGAVEFLQAAHKKGVEIFYVSNRDTGEIGSTLINLQKLGLPDTDTAHMRFMMGVASKKIRQQRVMADHNVILLLGDNLNDFMQVFENRSVQDRFTETDKEKAEWGKKFIVLPNPVYGEWENAVYDYEHNLTPQQKEAKRAMKLRE